MAIEKYVIVRCSQAGVHAGVLVAESGQRVELRESRRLWSWTVPLGAPSFLSGVASEGIDPAGSTVGTPIDVVLLEACEILMASAKAEASIRSAQECLRTR